MKIHTIIILKDLAGEELKDQNKETITIGKALANVLSSHDGTNRLKLFILAQKFFSDEFVTIDSADRELIKTAIEKTRVYNNLVAGQLLLMLEGIKEE